MTTPFQKKCEILAELWMKYRSEETLEDFFQYNDVSLPLAFMISEEIISEKTQIIESFIEETFIIFLAAVGAEDTGFDNLDEILVQYFEEETE